MKKHLTAPPRLGSRRADAVHEYDVESLDGFQNDDASTDWESHDPEFAWTPDDLQEFEEDERGNQYQQQREAMAAWWEMEGVRCATFGRNPTDNPYLE